MTKGTAYSLQVHPRVPARLKRLEELANNLWYSWDRPTRALFGLLHPGLWNAVANNPKAFLQRVDEKRLLEASEDPVFLGSFNKVLSAYDTYHNEPLRRDGAEWLRGGDLVAYFCAEFGFHESFPIYSGGLGILAGDHCKSASDMRLPFVGVGLLYRQGYFSQVIDAEGNQHASYRDSEFESMPIEPALDSQSREIRVEVELSGRSIAVKAWRSRIGHVYLYLLDTDIEPNSERDRNITHRLYGGDRTTRIEQEIVLGVGGVRLLAALGLKPTVWHINEGHAAFLVIERMRLAAQQGLSCHAALEAVAANTVFTTHTPVPAGHDHFSADMLWPYFERHAAELGVGREDLLGLGRSAQGQDFNMTALALRGSRFNNGVSRIHGDTSAEICAAMWPQVDADENPLTYVTNGVHVPTFLAQEWHEVFERYLGFGWAHRLCDVDFWQGVNRIPDQLFWSVRQSLKAQMLHFVRQRITQQHFRNNGSEAHLDRLLKLADPRNPNVLTIGFARRFATYKRAGLLFDNLDWLKEIVADAKRPVVFIFAGKAHPADAPGQDLIRHVHRVARMQEFEGRLLLVEDYEMRLARRLVSGCDVWLNNPIYPMEASGTSGMKAAINGGINLSVLDGWWGEAYDGLNGWAIKPASPQLDDSRRAREEAVTLYELLQDHVAPLYYERGEMGYSPGWVKMAKYSIISLLPRFNSTRMVIEYLRRSYLPASQQGRRFGQDGYAAAQEVAVWKQRVRESWPGVQVRRIDQPHASIAFGDSMQLRIAVRLNGLAAGDVKVELIMGRPFDRPQIGHSARYELEWEGVKTEAGEDLFSLVLTPELCGKLQYRIRVYPCHEMLTHPLETGLMIWL
jgi:starch phosphorylase